MGLPRKDFYPPHRCKKRIIAAVGGLAVWGLPGEVGGERVLGDSKERRDALPLLTLRNPGLSARPVI